MQNYLATKFARSAFRKFESAYWKTLVNLRKLFGLYTDNGVVDNDPLLCVITGMEKSGTTLLSQLLNGHPNIASGVELGFLLSNIIDFRRISPFYGWLINTNWGWGVRPDDREKLSAARSFSEMYFMLNKFKGKNHKDPYLRELFQNSEWIYDKTPKYIYDLNEVIRKVDKPFIVTFKSPLEAVASLKSRGQGNVEKFLKGKYTRALIELQRAVKLQPERILVVQYKTLASRPVQTMTTVKSFIGIDDDIDLSLERYNQRFGNYIESRNSFHNDSIKYIEPSPVLSETEKTCLESFMRQHKKALDFIERNSI